MKRSLIPLLVLGLFVCAPSYSLPGHELLGAPMFQERVVAEGSGQSDLDARIARIENGLVPPNIIKGRPIPSTSVADLMAQFGVPGVSVAFFDSGQIVWTRTYGYADAASKTPVTPKTLFQAASISKPVAALAALRLVQEGKLSLDENVNKRLRSWQIPENEFTSEQKVTLRRLLSHSAGLNVHGFDGYATGEPVPTVVQVLNGEKPANSEPVRVDTVPGTLWRYSGGGYVVVQLLLTDTLGKPFPQILHDLVLQPAGMAESTYEQPLPKNLAPLAATPYRANDSPVQGGWHTYPEMAAAGLWTTPSDLARLAIEVQKEYAGKSSKILSQEMMRQMLTRQSGDYGLGFELESVGRAQRFSHGGANAGFGCDLEAYIGSGQGVVIMSNSDNGGFVTAEFLASVAREYNWPDFQPKERILAQIGPTRLHGYAGAYELTNSSPMNKLPNITVTDRDDQLYLQFDPFGPVPVQILPESETSFFTLHFSFPLTFERDRNGVVSGLVMILGGDTYEAKRVQ